MTPKNEKFPRPPDKRENARRVRTDALSKFGGFAGQNTETDATAQALTEPHFERMVEHLHRLGPRPVGELLIEIAIATGQSSLVMDRLQAYARLNPEIVNFVGGDHFPPSVLGVVR